MSEFPVKETSHKNGMNIVTNHGAPRGPKSYITWSALHTHWHQWKISNRFQLTSFMQIQVARNWLFETSFFCLGDAIVLRTVKTHGCAVWPQLAQVGNKWIGQSVGMSRRYKQRHYWPGQALRFPGVWCSHISRYSTHECGRVVSLKQRLPLPPWNISGTHFCEWQSQLQNYIAVRRIVSIKNSNNVIGNRTRDLLASSALIQPSGQTKNTQ